MFGLVGKPAVAVRTLPKGRAKAIRTTTGCAKPQGPPFSAEFVSAVVKNDKGQRSVLNFGSGILIVPEGSFRSAVVKVIRGTVTLASAAVVSLTGPRQIDTGGVILTSPLVFETTVQKAGATSSASQPTVRALFRPVGGAIVELPVGQIGQRVRVSIPDSGTFELLDEPSRLPPPPPVRRLPTEPSRASRRPRN